MSHKICKVCKAKFMPWRPLQSCCSFECEVKRGQAIAAKSALNREKIARKELREQKKKAKTKRQWLKEGQVWFNRWIKLRDKGLPCISCGSFTESAQAGHYRSVGACSTLRFCPENCNLQCVKCNHFLSGNAIPYRQGLIKKYGQEVVDWIEGGHDPAHWSVDDIKTMIQEWKEKIRELS